MTEPARNPDPPPEPRRSRRAADVPPPRRFGPSRLELLGKRDQLRDTVRSGGQVLTLADALPRESIPAPKTVPLLRLLARRAVFSYLDRPPRVGHETRKDFHGLTHVYGQQLSWQDLRVLLLIFYVYRHRGALRHPDVILPPAMLGRMLRDGHASAESIEQVRQSLVRLTQAQIHLEHHDAPIGSFTEPVGFLDRDDRPRAAANAFRLRGWLHELLVSGIDDPRSGLVEYWIDWPTVRLLQGRTLLLYLFLECEDFTRLPERPHPLDPKSRERFKVKHVPLCPEFLVLVGLHDVPPTKMRQVLRRAGRTIRTRDGRYEFLDIPRDGDRLEIWKRPGRPQPDLNWTGRLCANCQRADPHGVCCCTKPTRCGHAACQRCAEEF